MNRTRHDFAVYLEKQAELLSQYLSAVLNAQVSKEQVKTAIYAMCRPKNQPEKADTPERVAKATLDAVTFEVAPQIDTKSLLRLARDRGATIGEAIAVFSELQSPRERTYAAYARENLASEGDLEFDADCIVSLSEDGGAYVQGWKWVNEWELP